MNTEKHYAIICLETFVGAERIFVERFVSGHKNAEKELKNLVDSCKNTEPGLWRSYYLLETSPSGLGEKDKAIPCLAVDDASETAVPITNVGVLRQLIKDLPDSTNVYLFGVGAGDTVYNVNAEVRHQECVEHKRKKWLATGLMIGIE